MTPRAISEALRQRRLREAQRDPIDTPPKVYDLLDYAPEHRRLVRDLVREIPDRARVIHTDAIGPDEPA